MKQGIKGFRRNAINKGFFGYMPNSNPVTPIEKTPKGVNLSHLWSLYF